MNEYQKRLLEETRKRVLPVEPYIAEKEFQAIIAKVLETGFIIESDNGFYDLRTGVVTTIEKTMPEILAWWEQAINFLPHCIGAHDRDINSYLTSLTEIVHRFVKGHNQQEKIDELSCVLKYEFEKEIYVMLTIFVAQKALGKKLIEVVEGQIIFPIETKVKHALWNTEGISVDEFLIKFQLSQIMGLKIEELLDLLTMPEDKGDQKDHPFDI